MKKFKIIFAALLLIWLGCEWMDNDEIPERMVTGVKIDEDMSGDLRPEAIKLIHERKFDEEAEQLSISTNQTLSITAPKNIRVWRRGLDGSTSSCSGRVDIIPIQQYVKGVLPHEWYRTWHSESLKTGAVAIRTYGVWWIKNGGKYSCADVDDTTASQVYKDEFFQTTNAATDATANMYLTKSGSLVFAEYSAENADPTAYGVADPVCAGYTRKGHGRGTCQWGSQRWANKGKIYTWILTHYYPGASVTQILPPSDTIIIDSKNANNNTSKGYISASTNWTASSATSGYYGSDYLYASTAAINDPAVFYFYLEEAGTKTIDAWWTAGSNRSPTATFIITNSTGSKLATVQVNQSLNGGKWNTLGTWNFTAGWNQILLSRWTTSGKVVIADAVRVR